MSRLPLFLLCVAASLLMGCPFYMALPPPPPQLPQLVSQPLESIYTEHLPRMANFLEFSGSGKTFVVAGKYKLISLYDTMDFEKRVAIQKNDSLRDLLAIEGVGYVDDNTWYFVMDDYTEGARSTSVNIRQIEPPREIYKYNVGTFPKFPVHVNRNHIAHNDTLLNWHNGNIYKISQLQEDERGYEMMPDGQIVTQMAYGKVLTFHNITKRERTVWHINFSGLFFKTKFSSTASYAVTTTAAGECALWQLPQKKQVGPCGRRGIFRKNCHQVVFNRDDSAFAILAEREILVYTTQPFNRIAAITTSEGVYALTLEENRLAVTDASGAIWVWDVAKNKLIGQYIPDEPMREHPDARQHYFLAFQPKGHKLVAVRRDQLLVFDLGVSINQAAP